MTRSFGHYLTYQHNVQKYFRDYRDVYSGVIVPLSIAISFPTGTYGFVRALCAKDKDKQYAIDPRTPLFQKAWDRSKVREPHIKMADVLGEPFRTKGIASALRPADFVSDDVIKQVARACVEVQQKFRTRDEDSRKLAKYKKLLGVTDLGELCEPQFLIPPYFQFSTVGDAWYQVCLRLIDATMDQDPKIPVSPIIHMESWQSVLNWENLALQLKSKSITSLWFYPNDFREHLADAISLRRYRAAVESVSESGVKCHSLFGGYFSVLMSKFGLAGFSNGIGYGEWRDSGYHRGGTADIRIYVPKLHRFVGAPEVQSLLDVDAEYFASDSELLASCVESGRSATTVDLAESLEHFLECRRGELSFVASETVGRICGELGETEEHLRAIGPLEFEKFGSSLERWRAAIS